MLLSDPQLTRELRVDSISSFNCEGDLRVAFAFLVYVPVK